MVLLGNLKLSNNADGNPLGCDRSCLQGSSGAYGPGGLVDGGDRTKAEPLLTDAGWRLEPRTPAWDELWRRIFLDVMDARRQVPEGKGKHVPAQSMKEIEGADGGQN